jgi:hypothetical protein
VKIYGESRDEYASDSWCSIIWFSSRPNVAFREISSEKFLGAKILSMRVEDQNNQQGLIMNG